MSWPHSIPDDLRYKLEAVMGFRSCGPSELWGEIRDWLEHHEVPAPDRLPERPKSEEFFDQ